MMFSVPLTAGSISISRSAPCGAFITNGLAVWNTKVAPRTASSKLPGTVKSAWNHDACRGRHQQVRTGRNHTLRNVRF